MPQKRVKSPVPLYLALVPVVCWGLFGKLYRLQDFIILALVTFAVYWIAGKIFRGKLFEAPLKIPEAKPEPAKTTGDPELDALLKEGEVAIAEMSLLRKSIADLTVQDKVQRIIEVSGKILATAADDKRDIPRARKFLRYYLPTTLKLLHAYDRMSGISSGDNTVNTTQKIEDMLDDLISAYNKQLDAMFGDEALDIDSDIKVMDAMLRKENLL
ncbi:MAG: 5-bromo-4-chloroindolyl phosphate hydrolysis family protein [Oscillospiraceae bacterium]|jgi:hypothetical protein|nr:5-bromo-4-chloroindolyl phosphate hydrolysis family protein [Oscillospiraceae bacterium]